MPDEGTAKPPLDIGLQDVLSADDRPASGRREARVEAYSRLGVSTEHATSFQQHYAAGLLIELADPGSDGVAVQLGGEYLVDDVVVERTGDRREHIQVKQVLSEWKNWTVGRLGDPDVDFWKRTYAIHLEDAKAAFVLATDGTCSQALDWVNRVFRDRAQAVQASRSAWSGDEVADLDKIAGYCGCTREEVIPYLQLVRVDSKRGAYDVIESDNENRARALFLPPDAYLRVFDWVCRESVNHPRVDRAHFEGLLNVWFGRPVEVDERLRDEASCVQRAAEGDLLAELSDPEVSILLVCGAAGSGKTRLLNGLAGANNWPAHYLQLGGGIEQRQRYVLTEALYGLMARMRDLGWTPIPLRHHMTPRDVRDAFEGTLASAAASATDGVRVLVIDGVDETTTTGGQQEILDYFLGLVLPPNVKLAVGVRPGLAAPVRADAREWAVPPLTESETAAMVQASGRAMSAYQLGRLRERSEGNPLYVRMFLRALEEKADVGSALDAAANGLAAYVKQTVAHVAGNEPTAFRVLQLLSVAGGPLDAEVVAHAVGVTVLALQGTMSAKARSLLLPGRWSLAHHAIRQLVCQDMGADTAAELHGALAEALDALPPGRPERVEIADHLRAAGRREELFGRLGVARLQERLTTDSWQAIQADILHAVDALETLEELVAVMPALALLDCMAEATKQRCDPEVIRWLCEVVGLSDVRPMLLKTVASTSRLSAIERILGNDALSSGERESLKSEAATTSRLLVQMNASPWARHALLLGPDDTPQVTPEVLIQSLSQLQDLEWLERHLDDYCGEHRMLSREQIETVLANLEQRDLTPRDRVHLLNAKARVRADSVPDILEIAARVCDLASPDVAVPAAEALLWIAWRLRTQDVDAARAFFDCAVDALVGAPDRRTAMMVLRRDIRQGDFPREWLDAKLPGVVAAIRAMPASWTRLDAMCDMGTAQAALGLPVAFSRDEVLGVVREMPPLTAESVGDWSSVSGYGYWSWGWAHQAEPPAEAHDWEIIRAVEDLLTGADLGGLPAGERQADLQHIDDVLEALARKYRAKGMLDDEARVVDGFHSARWRTHYRVERLCGSWEGLGPEAAHEQYGRLPDHGLGDLGDWQFLSLERALFARMLSEHALPRHMASVPLMVAESAASDDELLATLAAKWGAAPDAWGGSAVKGALISRAHTWSSRQKRLAVLRGIAPSLSEAEVQQLSRELLLQDDQLYVSGQHMADIWAGRALAARAPEVAASKLLEGQPPRLAYGVRTTLVGTLPADELLAARNGLAVSMPSWDRVECLGVIAARVADRDPAAARDLIDEAHATAHELPECSTDDLDARGGRGQAHLNLLRAVFLTPGLDVSGFVEGVHLPQERALAQAMLVALHGDAGDGPSATAATNELAAGWPAIPDDELSCWLVGRCGSMASRGYGRIEPPGAPAWLRQLWAGLAALGDEQAEMAWLDSLCATGLSPAEVAGVVKAALERALESDDGSAHEFAQRLTDFRQHSGAWPSEADGDVAQAVLYADAATGLEWLKYTAGDRWHRPTLAGVRGAVGEATWAKLRDEAICRRGERLDDYDWFRGLVGVGRLGCESHITGAMEPIKTAIVTAHATRTHGVDLSWVLALLLDHFGPMLSPEQVIAAVEGYLALTMPFR